jgi:two-component system phosphate regulon response regulator OmpR
LRTLVEDGLVESRIGNRDKRERHLYLTEAGAGLERQLSDAQRRRMRDAYRAAGPEAVAGFRRVLEAMMDPEMRAEGRRAVSFVDEAHLLVISPDPDMRRLLMKYLNRRGFYVTGARGADHAERLLAGLDFALVVLDCDAPDAFAAIPALGGAGQRPVVALLGKAAGAGDAGAAATLRKPFEPQELIDLVNGLLGRDARAEDVPEPPRMLALGPLRYDLEQGEMWNGAEPVRLTATESLLMRIFAARPGEPLSRAQLVSDLGRGGGQSQERAVDVQITRLRRKIEPDPKSPRYLQTVRGAGYLLAPD